MTWWPVSHAQCQAAHLKVCNLDLFVFLRRPATKIRYLMSVLFYIENWPLVSATNSRKPLSPQIFFFFFCETLSLTSALFMCLEVGISTESWKIYQWPYIFNKMEFPLPWQLLAACQQLLGKARELQAPPHCSAWIVAGSFLCRSTQPVRAHGVIAMS